MPSDTPEPPDPSEVLSGPQRGKDIDYPVTLTNKGYKTDSYTVTVSGTFTGAVRDAQAGRFTGHFAPLPPKRGYGSAREPPFGNG